MGIHPDTVTARYMDIGDQAGTGHKILRRILSIDTALNGMACDGHILLAHT